jgi:peptide methionine sulfoxide reductase msrA/msrB
MNAAVAAQWVILCLVACIGACTIDFTDAPSPVPKQATTSPTMLSESEYSIKPLPRQHVAELAKRLTPEQYRITQKAGTEAAFCGNLLDNKKTGVDCCVVCGLPLFTSEHKFNSGTGWPSFHSPFDPQHIKEKEDRSHGMVRTEITCTRCDAHLGHVFGDGPQPTGRRYCLNSEAMAFYEEGQEGPPASRPANVVTAYFAGGCFWGIEHYFAQGPGVLNATSGYMQGHVENPTYEQVCTGATGHAESVKVVYDENLITYRRLLEAFFALHDPTQLNRQGPDVGTQYRSGVYYVNDKQRDEALALIEELTGEARFGDRTIVTEVQQAKTFYPAEDYHQGYIERAGRACHVADPW